MQKLEHDSKIWVLESSARYPDFNIFYLSKILRKNVEIEQYGTVRH